MRMKSKKTAASAAVCAVVASLVAVSLAESADSRVEFRECPKCDKRIRIDLSANKAYVNLSRLEGADKDEIAARAARLLDAAKIPQASDPKIRPLMGWSSWNTFGVDISEEIILETARAMATNGLKDAGYTYVNIDDGFFWGHGEDGVLRFHPERFPNGMKPVVDGIHALGLKAGIYSDAGADTCGSMWGGSGSGGKDSGGVGGGLYGHDAADCKLHFNDLGFDFIKVDYCGAGKLKLDEKTRYTEIADAIKATGRTDVRLNLCRWAFPGTWAADIAESWRTTGDIRANWKSVKKLIGENLYLSAYAKPGHYNDMDMLEVGQLKGEVKSIFGKHGDTGLTPDEETTHFGMWCMLSSPLLIGCDVRTIPASTKTLVTNPYLLAVNQNDLGCQAYVVQRDGDAYVLVKDAVERFGRSRYVALYNGSDDEHEFTVRADALDLDGSIDAFDLVAMADVGRFTGEVSVKVAPHASRFYRFDAERRVMRKVYEAETAFLSDYQELRDAAKAGTAFPDQCKGASGGVIVRYIGNRATNDLVWPDVKVDAAGEYVLLFRYASPEDRAFDVSVDGGAAVRVAAPATGGGIAAVEARVRLEAGVHRVRLYNDSAWMPDMDRMTLEGAPRPRGLRLMSYNVLHCEGADKKIDIARTAEVIKREKPRFVGLQELDSKAATRSGGVDQPAELCRLTGMYATFARAIPFQGGGYGVAVLSREKPISVFRTPLPGKEPRVLLLCEFEDCWFGTTHLSLQETNRLASVEIIRKAVAERSAAKPVYLTGDWNARPDSKVLDEMRSFMTILSATTGRTYHGFKWSTGPDGKTGAAPAGEFCIDYIAVDSASARKLVVRESHVVPDTTTSDHSPVVATICPAGKPFSICSFNMRTDCDKGEHAWTNRLPLILKVIEDHRFDVIGAQELKLNQVAHLRGALGPKGYEIVGRGRLAEGKSEGVYIIYNARRFECLASDTFQLSETPEVWGSSSWESAYPRTCGWVLLKDRETGVQFRFYNTHLDHVSELARRKGMELVVGRINSDVSSGMTAFLTGDMNNVLKPGNAVDFVRKSMYDTADVSLSPHTGPLKTFHGWNPPACMLIDYVFVKGPVRVLTHATLDDMPEGKVPSDHFPVAATVVLPRRMETGK